MCRAIRGGFGLLAQHAPEMAQVLRARADSAGRSGKTTCCRPVSRTIPTILVAVGWNAALVYDTPAGAADLDQDLEYATRSC